MQGAGKAHVTDFSFDWPGGGEGVGRWWYLENPGANNITFVEVVGVNGVLTDELLKQFEDSLEYVGQ